MKIYLPYPFHEEKVFEMNEMYSQRREKALKYVKKLKTSSQIKYPPQWTQVFSNLLDSENSLKIVL